MKQKILSPCNHQLKTWELQKFSTFLFHEAFWWWTDCSAFFLLSFFFSLLFLPFNLTVIACSAGYHFLFAIAKMFSQRLRFATFNVRGLTSLSKQQQLARDILTYRVAFWSVQELKIKELVDIPLGLSHRLMGFGQSSGRHGGIGFVVSNQLNKFISKFKNLSDRFKYVDILVPQPGRIQHRLYISLSPMDLPTH